MPEQRERCPIRESQETSQEFEIPAAGQGVSPPSASQLDAFFPQIEPPNR